MIYKKKIGIGILLILVSFLVIGSVNAQTIGDRIPSSVCCKETVSGGWCQQVPEDECASIEKAPTDCSNTAYCSLGTCINAEEGVCMSNTPKARCDDVGGIWKMGDSSEIPECQLGCCLMGDDVAMVTKTKCLQMASDYSIDVNFREDITDQGECFAIGASQERGACIVESEYEIACEMTLKNQCLKKENTDSYLEMLKNPVSDVKVEFHKGQLCTNQNLGTDCAPTADTTCYEDDRIYFLDSCGNRANVYDASKTDNQDYWDFVQTPNCGPVTADDVGKTTQENCGDCRYVESTKCQKPKSQDSTLSDGGDYVCSDLSCEYKGKEYLNGESWCAETNGTVHHIKVDENGNIKNDSWDKLLDFTEYNLPGSEYVKLSCYEGEVLKENCGSKRNFFCGEYDVTNDYTIAQCYVNPWDECLGQKTKSDCLKTDETGPSYCVWMPGLRFDQKKIKGEDNRKEKQGSCVPLIAPGFEFWNEEGAAQDICGMGYVKETALYEVNWYKKREKLANGEWDKEKKAGMCWLNCYGIPEYGVSVNHNFEDLKDIWEDGADPTGKSISERLGHYCHEKNEPEKLRTGAVAMNRIRCVEDPQKRNEPPIFLTNDDFMAFITTRTGYLGDCGIKDNAYGGGGEGKETYQQVVQSIKQEGTEFVVQSILTEIDDVYDKSVIIGFKGGTYNTYYEKFAGVSGSSRRSEGSTTGYPYSSPGRRSMR